jgi:hypothetical protein
MGKKKISKNKVDRKKDHTHTHTHTHKNKNIVDLNSSICQLDLIAVYLTFHPKKAEIKIFSSMHGAFVKINHIITH